MKYLPTPLGRYHYREFAVWPAIWREILMRMDNDRYGYETEGIRRGAILFRH